MRNKACIREKCMDPCPGSCGLDAHCSVMNHIPSCICPEGFIGDPFTNCQRNPQPRKSSTANLKVTRFKYELQILQRKIPFMAIPVTHHLADQMLNVTTEYVVVFPNIMATHILAAVQNVYLTQIVLVIRPVCAANV